MKSWLFAALAIVGQWTDVSKIDAHQTMCLAQTIYHEARGEPVRGQLLVAEVVLNRVETEGFPKTICKVVYQRGGTGKAQFSWTNGKKQLDDWTSFYNAVEIAVLMQTGGINRQHPGVLFFFNPRIERPSWADDMKVVTKAGDHLFLAFKDGRA
ncbi:cell wall hydrolase [Magnetospirillum molischianum]|uniref:Cell wall hydrolase, SleB n=1 Tax=Magnetospirillum molischianum DSM 120 TaxID=1150626 RepID=H8FYD7_MAGML